MNIKEKSKCWKISKDSFPELQVLFKMYKPEAITLGFSLTTLPVLLLNKKVLGP